MLKHFNLRHLFTFLELWTKVCKSLNKFDDGFQQTTIHNKGKNEFIPTEFPPFIQFNWCMHFRCFCVGIDVQNIPIIILFGTFLI